MISDENKKTANQTTGKEVPDVVGEDTLVDGIPVVYVEYFCHDDCSEQGGEDPCNGCHRVKFWCPYCEDWHRHGAPDGIDELDHRNAHCTNPESPYRKTGYILRLREPARLEL